MYIENPNSTYPFCPGKATWDPRIASLYNSLIITAYTGKMVEGGGINAQPGWYVDLLAWFLIAYDNAKFHARAKSVLGDSKVRSQTQAMPSTAGRQVRKRR